jgi:hypothetical protein
MTNHRTAYDEALDAMLEAGIPRPRADELLLAVCDLAVTNHEIKRGKEPKTPFVARDLSGAQYVKVAGQPDACVGLVAQDREGEKAVWVMEEDTVPLLIATLSGGLTEDSIKILEGLSKTDIVSAWEVTEDEEAGVEEVRLVLYEQVECLIPTHEANSAIQMLDRVLHAQGHKQLGD